MMTNRENLQKILEEIIGSENVYYQPPETMKLNYPAIVYSRNTIDNLHANNLVYKQDTSYIITVIDKDPDSEIVNKLSKIPMCKFDRHFTSDNLNHDTFTLYY